MEAREEAGAACARRASCLEQNLHLSFSLAGLWVADSLLMLPRHPKSSVLGPLRCCLAQTVAGLQGTAVRAYLAWHLLRRALMSVLAGRLLAGLRMLVLRPWLGSTQVEEGEAGALEGAGVVCLGPSHLGPAKEYQSKAGCSCLAVGLLMQ